MTCGCRVAQKMLIRKIGINFILEIYMEELMKKYIIGISAGLALIFAGFAMASGDTFVPPKATARGGFVIGANVGYGELNTPNIFANYNEAFLNSLFSTGGIVPLPPFTAKITSNSSNQDTGAFIWGVNLGYDHQLAKVGWLSNALLGFEVGYKDLGESVYTHRFGFVFPDTPAVTAYAKAVYKAQAISVLLKADYYIVGGWHMFAKGGVAALYTKYQYTQKTTIDGFAQNSIGTQSAHYWNLRPEYVLGTGYTFSPFGAKKNMSLEVHAFYDHIFSEPTQLSTTDEALANPSLLHGGQGAMGAIVAVPGVNMVMGGIDFSFNPFV